MLISALPPVSLTMPAAVSVHFQPVAAASTGSVVQRAQARPDVRPPVDGAGSVPDRMKVPS